MMTSLFKRIKHALLGLKRNCPCIFFCDFQPQEKGLHETGHCAKCGHNIGQNADGKWVKILKTKEELPEDLDLPPLDTPQAKENFIEAYDTLSRERKKQVRDALREKAQNLNDLVISDPAAEQEEEEGREKLKQNTKEDKIND